MDKQCVFCQRELIGGRDTWWDVRLKHQSDPEPVCVCDNCYDKLEEGY